MARKIAECPFCGEVADVGIEEVDEDESWRSDFEAGVQVRCYTCGAAGPTCATRNEACAKWNAVSSVPSSAGGR